MKIKISNKISARALRRFKLMCIAVLSYATVQYFVESGIKQVQEFQFVEAGQDFSYEHDDLYNKYIESAKFQSELLKKEKRDSRQVWTLDHYRRFQARRLQTILATNELLSQMEDGTEGWYELVLQEGGNFDTIPTISQKPSGFYTFKTEEYEGYEKYNMSQGYMEEYYGEARCFSALISNPGISLLPAGLMGFAYLVFLGYLFLGISISADIFMEAIEVITSKTTIKELKDEQTGMKYMIEEPAWNATMANLTLMAFGSSAPEIILSTLEAVKGLGEPAGDLGPSTIVGSAAFNLLVISGVSVYAVGTDKNGEEKGLSKWIDDMGVFITTAVFSIFAYVWLYICLSVNSEGIVTISEASWTFGFFFILLFLAFGADKFNQAKKKRQSAEEEKKNTRIKNDKATLRSIARTKGKSTVIQAAQGLKVSKDVMTENEVSHIKELYVQVLGEQDLSKATMDQLAECLEPDALFERFAYRKARAVGQTKEFMDIKGQKFQAEMMDTVPPKKLNPKIGFKCTHYAVTESAGVVTITLVKKTDQQTTVGVRTFSEDHGGAVAKKDYEPINQKITIPANKAEETFTVKIYDNNEVNPDLDFQIEIYDYDTEVKLMGDDAQCKVTIIDEDNAGTLEFKVTEIKVSANQDKVDIVVARTHGTDGKVSCRLRTEPYIANDENNIENAKSHEDYLHKEETLEFASGEAEATFTVFILNEKLPGIKKMPKVNAGIQGDQDEGSDEGVEEEEILKKFKVVLDRAEPAKYVKVSKKNCCIVSIVQEDTGASVGGDVKGEHTKMIDFFINQRNPTWSDQFKNAVQLGPTIDEDDNFDDVTLFEAFTHFATIGWKILFAAIPPTEWGGGWPAFIVALTMIGTITAVVAEVATVLGCTLGLKDAVTAITLVAVGTSLPDTFASMSAAQKSEYADSAIGNVTGSNSVNVFVGLGLPWLISAVYASKQDPPQDYETPPGNLAFSVMLFLITSLTCFLVLGVRRAVLGGELGGPKGSRTVSAVFLVSLWLIYVIFSSLKAYGVIGAEGTEAAA